MFFLLRLLSNITAVTASMPGYKSKNTTIWLEEGAAMSLDFVLDPDTTTKGKPKENCDCYNGNNSLESLDFVRYMLGHYFEAYILMAIVLVFICFLFRRRLKSGLPKQRLVALPKRIVV